MHLTLEEAPAYRGNAAAWHSERFAKPELDFMYRFAASAEETEQLETQLRNAGIEPLVVPITNDPFSMLFHGWMFSGHIAPPTWATAMVVVRGTEAMEKLRHSLPDCRVEGEREKVSPLAPIDTGTQHTL